MLHELPESRAHHTTEILKMKSGLFCGLPLVVIAACALDDASPPEPEATTGVEQAVAADPELWCFVSVPRTGVQGAPANGGCQDPTPDGRDGEKVVRFFLSNGPIPVTNFEFRWKVPDKLNVLSGCDLSGNCNLRAPIDTACGDTQLTASVEFRDNRSPSNPWRTLTATAHLHLGSTKACRMAALDPPSCQVVLGGCAGTHRENWLWAVASINADETQRAAVGISYTGGNEWCTWYNMPPGDSEEWLMTVPTYTLVGRVQTETDWDISPHCTFYMNAWGCGDQEP